MSINSGAVFSEDLKKTSLCYSDLWSTRSQEHWEKSRLVEVNRGYVSGTWILSVILTCDGLQNITNGHNILMGLVVGNGSGLKLRSSEFNFWLCQSHSG